MGKRLPTNFVVDDVPFKLVLVDSFFPPYFCFPEIISWANRHKYTILAITDRKSGSEGLDIIGCLAFDIRNKKYLACGTWVKPRFRKLRIGKKMWQHALSKFKPNKVSVTCVTNQGFTLISSLKKRYRNIKWDIRYTESRYKNLKTGKSVQTWKAS